MPQRSHFSLHSLVSIPTLLNIQTHTSNTENEEDLSQVSLRRLLALNANEWWIIVIGAIAAAITGLFWPITGLIYGEVLEVYSRPSGEVLGSLYPFTVAMIATGAAVGIADFFSVSYLCIIIIYTCML